MFASPSQRRRWLSPSEILVLTIVALLLVALLLPSATGPPPLTDDDLNWGEWDPTSEQQMSPPADVLAADLSIAGEWKYAWRHTALDIKPDGPGSWRVTFRSGTGCSFGKSILLCRTAKYEDAVLVLDRPVQELSGKTYQRIYAVRSGDREYLVPSMRVDSVGRFLVSGRDKKDVQALEEEVMGRLVREPAQGTTAARRNPVGVHGFWIVTRAIPG